MKRGRHQLLVWPVAVLIASALTALAAEATAWSVQTVTLTTELDEFRQDVAVASNTAELTCIEINPNDWLGRAMAREFGLFVPADHILNKES